jgi:hypothetical protein
VAEEKDISPQRRKGAKKHKEEIRFKLLFLSFFLVQLSVFEPLWQKKRIFRHKDTKAQRDTKKR